MDSITVFGLVATFGQLAELAKNILTNMYNRYDVVKDVPKQSRALREEMGVIYNIFESL